MAKDPLRFFRIESKELLDALTRGVLELDARARSGAQAAPAEIKGAVTALLRAAHTLKGAARVVKQLEVADRAHSVEDVLAPFREGAQPPDQQTIRRLLALTDEIAASLRNLGSLSGQPPEPGAQDRQQPDNRVKDDALATVRVGVDELDQILGKLGETAVVARSLRAHAESSERDLQEIGMRARSIASKASGPRESRELHELLEEAVRAAERSQRELPRVLDRLEAGLRGVADRAGELRLIPAETIFSSLQRASRDAADLLGKSVEIDVAGGDIRLDANVLSAAKGALVHLVRNAVAHGIEKSGRVSVRIERRGSYVAFTCTDDGRGIDLESIRRHVVTSGKMQPEEASGLTLEQAIELLVQGGISTSKSADQVSGRAVGLDAARGAAASLNGNLRIRNGPGGGTEVELTAQVSLESLSVLGVLAGEVPAAIPARAVKRTATIARSSVFRVGERESVLLQGSTLPFVWLANALAPGRAAQKKAGTLSVVVVEAAGEPLAVGVDGIHDFQTVMMRPLPAPLASAPLVAGVFLDPDGDPRLVLDLAVLPREAADAGPASEESAATGRAILVIDDSLTTRMLEQSILESAGYRVAVARSAEEGLEMARKAEYALFVVDVEMPGMNGFEFIAYVGRDAALSGVPAILVTSRASAEDRRKGVEAGARAHIMKSEFEQGKFLKTVRELIG